MTREEREETIRVLKLLIPKGTRGNGKVVTNIIVTNTILNAIKALEQETCDDAISRQAVLEYIEGSEAELGHSSENELVCQYIKELPPVKPQPKGHERKFEEIKVGYPPAELCTYPEYRGKPYFSIKYEENGEHIIGFGTYKPEMLSRYLREYFISPAIIEEDKAEIEE